MLIVPIDVVVADVVVDCSERIMVADVVVALVSFDVVVVVIAVAIVF